MTGDEIKLIEEKRKREKESQESYENLNYVNGFERAFNHPQIKKSEFGHIPPDFIPDISRRREQIQEDIRGAMNKELPQLQRFKRVPAKVWEQKNNEIRTFLREQYGGKCQICSYSFTKRDGEPYFEGLYLVSRTKGAWIDRSGNVLCLCANCCAKFEHGQIEADNVLEQVSSNENGTGNLIVKIKLCNEKVELKFSERHILDLQEMLKANVKD